MTVVRWGVEANDVSIDVVGKEGDTKQAESNKDLKMKKAPHLKLKRGTKAVARNLVVFLDRTIWTSAA